MLVQVNSDHNIEGRTELVTYIDAMLNDELRRFQERITRVEVHLTDENSHKESTDDKRCLLEARVNGMPPIAVSNNAGSLHEAINGAKDKLIKKLDHEFGRLTDRQATVDDLQM